MSSTSYWPKSQSWRHYWPAGFVAVIAVIQLLVSFVILILQTVIVVVGTTVLCNGVTARYVMGFVCWAFFLACWISTFYVTCCNQSSVGWATYTLVKNILAFIFSAVLIDFDRRFITYPRFDYAVNSNSYLSSIYYYGINVCTALSTNDDLSSFFWEISRSLTKGQLAGAVLMLVTSLAFVSIYIYVYIRAFRFEGKISSNILPLRGPHMSVWSRSNIPSQPPPYVVAESESTIYQQEPIDSNPHILLARDGIETEILNF